MSYELILIGAEQTGENEYILKTQTNSYFYRFIDTTAETFLQQDEPWRNRVTEGQQILLDWIQNQTNTSPACITWNFKGKAMLEIRLQSIFHPISDYNTLVSEINPLEFKSVGKWVVDSSCPLLTKN